MSDKKMKFFTDRTVVNPYLLIQLKDYVKFNLEVDYEEIFIDPGVYQLQNSDKYDWEESINIMEFLGGLPDNHYFAADYPCDMNEQYTELFLKKSWDNAVDLHVYPQYIVTVQSKFLDFKSYKKWFKRYNELPIQSGILGVGNLCIIKRLTPHVKKVIEYTCSNTKHKRLHFYGLNVQAVTGVTKRKGSYMKIGTSLQEYEEMYGLEISVDGTGWTRAITTELKESNDGWVGCRKDTRQLYLDTWLEEVRKRFKFAGNNTIINYK